MLGDATFGRTRHEKFALLCHLLGLLFTHRTAQQIGTAQRISGQQLRNLHYLFLIQNHAVGIFQQRFQVRVKIIYFPLVL